MKRRYKAGDWFRVPLGAGREAAGIIVKADRSRLFGYFFAIPPERTPSHDDLRALGAAGAVATMYFGGAPLEEQRWPLLATSLSFDSSAWPVPEAAAIRYATPDQAESALREALYGKLRPPPFAVYEARSPLDPSALEMVGDVGRVQFSAPLAARDLDLLATFVRAHRDVELRVHGAWRQPFDAAQLAAFETLTQLTLDVSSVQNVNALTNLTRLRRLRVGAAAQTMPLYWIELLPDLRDLTLQGKEVDLSPLYRMRSLHALRLVDTPVPNLRELGSKDMLRVLVLEHVAPDLEQIAALRALERLELRDMTLSALPDLSRNEHLASIRLADVRGVRDLHPLCSAPSLTELAIENMPHLEVWDFQPLTECSRRLALSVDIGSKTKSREIYRMLRGSATGTR